MLKEILKSIYESGYYSARILANQLDTADDIVIDGINQLLRMGYLKKDEKDVTCQTACTGCAYAASCNKTVIETYQVTQKGLSLISSEQTG